MTAELVEYHAPAETTAVALWGTDDPRGMTARMSAVAGALADAVKNGHMSVRIGSNEYVKVEGWSMCGAMLGVFPRPLSVDEIRNPDGDLVGFRATVELVTRDGGVCGGAVALCTKDEPRWRDAEWNHIASMAQTRATAKAYRQTLGFIMPMAGYAATPAEEMDGVHVDSRPAFAAAKRQDSRDPAPANDDWWTYLMAAARTEKVSVADIAKFVAPQGGEPLKVAVRRWLNEHTAGDDLAADVKALFEAMPF